METIAKPEERTAERSLLRFWGIVFLLGPLPVCGGLALLLAKILPPEIGPVPTCGFFGALWGLASGVRSRTLSRAIVGLNVGFLIGSGAGAVIEAVGPNHRAFASAVVSVSMGLLTGLLSIAPPDRVWSFLKGVGVGFAALLVMCVTFFLLVEVLRNGFSGAKTPILIGSAFIASALGVSILLRGMQPKKESR